MISTKLMLNNVEYIIRAKNKKELDKAVQFLYNCEEPAMAELESQITALEMEVPTEVALETPVESKFQQRLEEEKAKLTKKPSTQKPKPAAKTPPKRSNPPKDNKQVNLGGMGKPE